MKTNARTWLLRPVILVVVIVMTIASVIGYEEGEQQADQYRSSYDSYSELVEARSLGFMACMQVLACRHTVRDFLNSGSQTYLDFWTSGRSRAETSGRSSITLTEPSRPLPPLVVAAIFAVVAGISSIAIYFTARRILSWLARYDRPLKTNARTWLLRPVILVVVIVMTIASVYGYASDSPTFSPWWEYQASVGEKLVYAAIFAVVAGISSIAIYFTARRILSWLARYDRPLIFGGIIGGSVGVVAMYLYLSPVNEVIAGFIGLAVGIPIGIAVMASLRILIRASK